MERLIIKKKKKSGLLHIISLAGKEGYILMGYHLIQVVFARGKADMAAIDGAAVVFAAYALLSGLYAFYSFQRDRLSRFYMRRLIKNSPIGWFTAYTVLCFISALWSPIPVLSAYRAVECAGMMLINAAVIKNLVVRATYRQIMHWAALYAFYVVGVAFVNGMRSGVGMALYNSQFPSTIFFYLAFYFAPKKIIRYPIMVVALLCRSVTGYVGMMFGMASLLWGKARYRVLGVIIAVVVCSSFFLYGVEDVLNETIFASKGGVLVHGEIDENKTSGRTFIWQETLRRMEEYHREWYGFGFVVGETLFARSFIGPMVIGMHNGFLSAYVGTGYIGFVLFIMFIFTALMLTINNHIPRDYRPSLIACMCVVAIHTFGNPGLGFRVYGTWMHTMFIIQLLIGLNFKGRFLNVNNKE